MSTAYSGVSAHQRDLRHAHRAKVTGSGTQVVPDALLGDGAAISANYAWTGRYFDSLPLPSRGYGLGAEIGVGMTTVGERKPFVRLQGRWPGFRLPNTPCYALPMICHNSRIWRS